ncbi:folylpolyglutamate synthase/dihydrofolate synthase family protein [Lacisediminihabitans sp.]|jgi:dihydrofolate synthase/folylpolyglutamate synthase|uniref:bifunctional folylpolyglutamate synthase/dihydrofolate synthase n=1 Tax=Lacisediminihabitans sp. TaxID=2787631 RepID=UPI002F95C7BC
MSKNHDAHDPELSDDSLYQNDADQVYRELLDRVGEANPQPRLGPTRRVVELLGDPQRAYSIIHITGTNGKTSTSRITESILRAYGLRTGLLTSPHLVRVNERIVVDGEPISNEAFVANYHDIRPYLLMVDAELTAAGELPLTFFEAFTALAFASFADAPVDVAVIEVGLGGEWDSTNVGDGVVAVFTPISLDHTARLGNTVAQIAATKSGIIKPAAAVVTSTQQPTALAELERAAELTESSLAVQGKAFELLGTTVAVGGQVLSVRGLAGTYNDLFLPLFGDHQAQNAAVAIAAVESFLGGGEQALVGDVLAEGLATAASPGRLQVIGVEPTVIIDAAHNPDGAESLTKAIASYFTFDEVGIVLGVLADKDARGIVSALVPITTRFFVTASSSDRAVPVDDLTPIVFELAGEKATDSFDSAQDAIDAAREWAAQEPRRGVVITGSITLIGEAITLAEQDGWKR